MNKKIFSIILLIILFLVSGCKNSVRDNNKITIISTSFPGYDFVRAIVKDSNNIEVKMLLKPGSETHDYEPTPQDIIDIQNASIFIYIGGESDTWVDSIINDLDTSKTKVIKLIDLVNTLNEETVLGMEEDEEEEEIDEHVWTSPLNVIKILDKLKDEIIAIDNSNTELYISNYENYKNKIYEIDSEIRELVANSKRKEIIFGDRFPLLYFVKEYGLSYYAAFKGCSHQSEASAKTISFLIDKVKSDNIPVIFHIELSNGNIANTIASETNAKVREFHSAHSITQKDFDNGITYIDIMKNNIEVLKEALN